MLIASLSTDQDCAVGTGTHDLTYKKHMKDYLDYGTVTELCSVHLFEVLYRMDHRSDLGFKWKSIGGTAGYLVYRGPGDLLR